MRPWIRLEGMDVSRSAGEGGAVDGEVADVGADIEQAIAGLDDPLQHASGRFVPCAVHQQRRSQLQVVGEADQGQAVRRRQEDQPVAKVGGPGRRIGDDREHAHEIALESGEPGIRRRGRRRDQRRMNGAPGAATVDCVGNVAERFEGPLEIGSTKSWRALG